jgi:hypothetical protein
LLFVYFSLINKYIADLPTHYFLTLIVIMYLKKEHPFHLKVCKKNVNKVSNLFKIKRRFYKKRIYKKKKLIKIKKKNNKKK